MLVATADNMRYLDQRTINEYNVPSRVLMENAAAAVLDTIVNHKDYSDDSRVLILCGRGNNAGDGFALALKLMEQNKNIDIFAAFGTGNLSDDADFFCNLCRKRNIRFLNSVDSLNYDFIVDAVFGIGFKGTLPSEIGALFSKLNKVSCTKISIDIPSGVNTDTGLADPNAFKADITVTFELKKPCHLLNCENTIVKNIGIKVFDSDAKALALYEIDTEHARKILPRRNKLGHKGGFGTLAIVAGCKSYQGAACMCTMSALRSGVGIVNNIVPDCIYGTVTSKINSAVVDSFKDDGQMLTADNINNILENIKRRRASAALIGCGIGIGEGTSEIVKSLLSLDIPITLDADALTLILNNLTKLNERSAATILTPHLGEFSRISKLSIEEIKSDRIGVASAFAKEYGVTLVLKDSITVIADPISGTAILSKPCSALAKGGSGDILAGLISSFSAQGLPAFDSAVLGVFIHNLSGRLAAEQYSDFCLLPDDIIKYIPKAFNKIICERKA